MGTAPRPGDDAPELTLPDLDGTVHSLADVHGQVTLVSFLRHAG